MKSRHGKKKRLTAAAVLLGILVIGWAVISYAAEDEYKVHHNILLILVEEHVIRYIISHRLIMEIMRDNGMMI